MGKKKGSPKSPKRKRTKAEKRLYLLEKHDEKLDTVRQKLQAKSYDARAAGRDYRRAFARYDKDDSGLLSYDEFKKCVKSICKLSKQEVACCLRAPGDGLAIAACSLLGQRNG